MKIVLATSNPGKLKEFRKILCALDYDFSAQSDYHISKAIENGNSFEENALIKARHGSRETGLPAIADDSGLEVDFLDGNPGIHSARYAGKNATDSENIEKLLDALEGVAVEKRSARFHCVIAMVRRADDPVPVICHGRWEGRIAQSPAGKNGFGYDPIFYVPALGRTSAELAPSIKNKNSHRAKALQQLRDQLL